MKQDQKIGKSAVQSRFLAFCGVLGLVLGSVSGCVAAGEVIYEKRSSYGDVVVTDDDGALRSLRFGRNGVPQSTIRVGDAEHLQFGYVRAVLGAFALIAAPQRILIIGLGGASLPMFIHQHYPNTQIDVVEIDPEVLVAAKLLFGFRESRRLKAYVADGRKFVERVSKGYYDVVILDAYSNVDTPAHLTTKEFLEEVRRIVRPSGVVAASFWGPNFNKLHAAMVRTYQEVFAEIHIVEASEKVNHVLFALPTRSGLTRTQFVERARRIGMNNRYRFDLGDVIEKGYLAEAPSATKAYPLRDRRLIPAYLSTLRPR